jgi:hypothetical protein
LLKNPLLNGYLIGIIYKNEKILKKVLTKLEKSGKIGKLSGRAAKNTALKALSKHREKI